MGQARKERYETEVDLVSLGAQAIGAAIAVWMESG